MQDLWQQALTYCRFRVGLEPYADLPAAVLTGALPDGAQQWKKGVMEKTDETLFQIAL